MPRHLIDTPALIPSAVPSAEQRSRAGRKSPLRRLPRQADGHRLFTIVFVFAAALRILTMLGYRPLWLYYGDSFSYLEVAEHPQPLWGFQPSGYPLLLWLLRPLHSLVVVAGIQHLLGLATGLLVYALLRRRSVPAWGGALAAVPVLLDASYLQLEHSLLSDTMFIFLIVATITVLMWSPRLSAFQASGAGLLMAAAALTRTIAVPLLALIVLYLLVRRVGWRRIGAVAAAAALPLVLYATWYAHTYGRFALAGGDGIALWARTMTFADCKKIEPPTELLPLCPNGVHQDAASEYVWAADSPLNQMPGGFGNNDRARSFALRAIIAQPLDYLSQVAHDVSLTFAWTPVRHPERITPAFGFSKGRQPLPDNPLVTRTVEGFDPGVREIRSVDPYAGFLRGYQYPAYLRGPMLALILLAGAAGVRRGAVLPFCTAAFLLIAPVAVLDFDHRYVLPVVPLACIAAALSLTGLHGRRSSSNRAKGSSENMAGSVSGYGHPATRPPMRQTQHRYRSVKAGGFMARRGQTKTPGAQLADHMAVAALVSAFPLPVVTRAIAQAGATGQRSRVLTAELTTYYVLGCALWHQYSHLQVWERLTQGLTWLNGEAVTDRCPPVTSSISEAKERLGSEPLRLLFEHVVDHRALTTAAGTGWEQRPKISFWNFVLDAHPGGLIEHRTGEGGEDSASGIRVVAAVEGSSGSIVNARAAADLGNADLLAQELISGGLFHPHTIMLMDGELLTHSVYAATLAAEADSVWTNVNPLDFPVTQRLPDRSWLSQIRSPDRRNNSPAVVRIAEYPTHGDERQPRTAHLATTVLDPDRAGLSDLIHAASHGWQFQAMFPGISGDRRGTVLRSRTPRGAVQETWAFLAVYQALRVLVPPVPTARERS